jgi:hypothetical protein
MMVWAQDDGIINAIATADYARDNVMDLNNNIKSTDHTHMRECIQRTLSEIGEAIVNLPILVRTFSRAKASIVFSVRENIKGLSAFFAGFCYLRLGRLSSLFWFLMWIVEVGAVGTTFRAIINRARVRGPSTQFFAALGTMNYYFSSLFVVTAVFAVARSSAELLRSGTSSFFSISLANTEPFTTYNAISVSFVHAFLL